jgi:hypothetical protein
MRKSPGFSKLLPLLGEIAAAARRNLDSGPLLDRYVLAGAARVP